MARSSQLDRMAALPSGSAVLAPPCGMPVFASLLNVAVTGNVLATAQQVCEGLTKHRVLLLLQ